MPTIPPSASDALFDWLRTAECASDLLKSERTSMAHQITSTIPHGMPEDWEAFVRAAKKREPHRFHQPPYCPEDRAARLKKMSAPERLEDENQKVGWKK